MRVRSTGTLKLDGTTFVPGEVLEIDDPKMLRFLLDRGAVTPEGVELAPVYEEDEEDPDYLDLDAMRVKDLQKLAREEGIHGYSDLHKEALIELIYEALGDGDGDAQG